VTRLSLGGAKVRQHLLGHSFCRDGCIEMRLRDSFENSCGRILVYGTLRVGWRASKKCCMSHHSG
jgi:hypothetical protein